MLSVVAARLKLYQDEDQHQREKQLMRNASQCLETADNWIIPLPHFPAHPFPVLIILSLRLRILFKGGLSENMSRYHVSECKLR